MRSLVKVLVCGMLIQGCASTQRTLPDGTVVTTHAYLNAAASSCHSPLPTPSPVAGRGDLVKNMATGQEMVLQSDVFPSPVVPTNASNCDTVQGDYSLSTILTNLALTVLSIALAVK